MPYLTTRQLAPQDDRAELPTPAAVADEIEYNEREHGRPALAQLGYVRAHMGLRFMLRVQQILQERVAARDAADLASGEFDYLDELATWDDETRWEVA